MKIKTLSLTDSRTFSGPASTTFELAFQYPESKHALQTYLRPTLLTL